MNRLRLDRRSSTPPPDFGDLDPESLAVLIYQRAPLVSAQGAWLLTNRALLSNLDQLLRVTDLATHASRRRRTHLSRQMFRIYAGNAAALGLVARWRVRRPSSRTASTPEGSLRMRAGPPSVHEHRRCAASMVSPRGLGSPIREPDKRVGPDVCPVVRNRCCPRVHQQRIRHSDDLEIRNDLEGSPASHHPPRRHRVSKAGSVVDTTPGVETAGRRIRGTRPKRAIRATTCGPNLFSGLPAGWRRRPDADGWFGTGDVAIADHEATCGLSIAVDPLW